jgi:spore germination protein YaaH
MRARRLSALVPLLAACAGGPTWSGVPSVTPRGDPIVAAFHVNWDPESRRSLLALRDRLDWVIAEWAFVADEPAAPVRVEPDTALVRLLAAEPRGPRLVLMLSNAQDADFDGARVARLLATPARRAAAIEALVSSAEQLGAVGLLLDFEALRPDQHDAVLAFAADLRLRLAVRGRLLLVAVPVGDVEWPTARYAAAADLLVPMLYDEHHPGGPPGPVASQPWYEASLSRLTAEVPAHRLLPGVATYGYLWRDSVAAPIGFTAGQDSAGHTRVAQRDSTSGALVTRWQDTDGAPRVLWQSDARTVLAQATAARRWGTAGVALWRLGAEDPVLRSRLTRRRLPRVSTP